jgi:hypothetical protein
MNKLAVALLATTVMGTPAAFAASDNSQQPQGQQTQQNGKQQSEMNQKNNKQQTEMGQSGQNAQNQNEQNAQNQQKQNQQSAQEQQSQQGKQQQSAENNQPISPQDLSQSEIKQVQQALQKEGFHAGPTDGLWGPETKSAVKEFQQSKQMQPTGQLDRQTVADLGLDASQFSQSQSQQQ